MDDKGASVLAKLRNKAKETGRSNQLCLQLFCQEEFLRRLQKSEYAVLRSHLSPCTGKRVSGERRIRNSSCAVTPFSRSALPFS